jgi:hypothetical protein
LYSSELQAPDTKPQTKPPTAATAAVHRDLLGGLIHEYEPIAA